MTISIPANKGDWAEFIAILCDDSIAAETRAAALASAETQPVTGEMLAEMAEYLLSRAISVPLRGGDLCGTGGDKTKDSVKTFNVSTAAAFVASCEMCIIKHGNRGVSSQSGSSDVLAALRVPVCTTPDEAVAMHEKHHLAFLSAPAFHPVLAAVAPVRKRVGKPTFFNLLGPLCNPARLSRQLIGVYDESFVLPMAEAAGLLGKKNVLVVHGFDGLDEISTMAPTRIAHMQDGAITQYTVTPEDLGITRPQPASVAGGTPDDNAAIIISALSGKNAAAADLICANAAAGFVFTDSCTTLPEGFKLARDVLQSGRALQKLRDVQA